MVCASVIRLWMGLRHRLRVICRIISTALRGIEVCLVYPIMEKGFSVKLEGRGARCFVKCVTV